MPVQGDSSGDEDLLTLLKGYIKDKYNKPGDVYLGLVHRLDRPVGGAMVFARTSKAPPGYPASSAPTVQLRPTLPWPRATPPAASWRASY